MELASLTGGSADATETLQNKHGNHLKIKALLM